MKTLSFIAICETNPSAPGSAPLQPGQVSNPDVNNPAPPNPVRTKEIIEPTVNIVSEEKEQQESQQIIQMTSSDFTKLVSALSEGFKESTKNNPVLDVDRIIRTVLDQGSGATSTNAEMITYDEIDTEDILDAPVLFFSYASSTVIFDDYKNGSVIRRPFSEPIRFNNIMRVTTSGKVTKAATTMSSYVCWSKKVAEWLRKHTNYNVLFFEQASDAKSIDKSGADALQYASNLVSSYDEHSIKRNCISHGVKIDTADVSVLRHRLIVAIAGRYEQEQKKLTKGKTLSFKAERENFESIEKA